MKPSRILGALWLFQFVNFLDRVVMSFAAPSIMKSLSMGPKSFGIVLSSFALGYFLAQLPGGLLADRFGAKPVLIIAPLFWSLFTGATGLMTTLAGFAVVRVCFGVSEGISNAACFKVIGDTFAPRERSRASAIWITALPIGAAFTSPLIALLITKFSWRPTFAILAVPALAIALVNYLVLPAVRRLREPIQDSSESATGRRSVSALSLSLRSVNLWTLSAAYFCFNIAYWGYVSWMPTYLSTTRHINLKTMGFLGAIPYVAGLFGLLLAGWLGSSVLPRHLIQLVVVTFALAGLSLYVAFHASTLFYSMAGLSGAAACLYAGLSNLGVILLNLSPSTGRATFSGVFVTCGQLGGIVAPAAIGYMVSETGSFNGAFLMMIASILLAAICLFFLIPAQARSFNSEVFPGRAPLVSLPIAAVSGEES